MKKPLKISGLQLSWSWREFPYSFKLLIYRTVYFCLFVYSSVFGDFCLLFITCQIIPFYHIKNIPFIIDASQCTYFIAYLIFQQKFLYAFFQR